MLYHQRLYIALFAYLIVAIAISSAYIYRIDPDGISYIGIAQKYALGNWHNAINPYWSPLCSWLMALFQFIATQIKLQGLLNPLGQLWLFKIISLSAGLFCIISTDQLLRITQASPFLHATLLYGSVPVILFYALNYLTPDLLSAAFVLAYFVCLLQAHYITQRRWAILCALAGIGAYLAKSYCLPFVLIHFTAWHLWLYYQCRITQTNIAIKANIKHQIKQRYLGAMAVLCVGCGIWIAIISWRSTYFTINNAAAYNIRLYSAIMPDHLFLTLGLLPPANETAICAWENISPYIDRTWQPKSIADYRLGFKINDNLQTLWKIGTSKPFYGLTLLIGLLYVLCNALYAKILSINQRIKTAKNTFFYTNNPSNPSQQIGVYLFAIILYISGYLPLMLEERYLTVVCLLMLPLTALLIETTEMKYKHTIIISTLK